MKTLFKSFLAVSIILALGVTTVFAAPTAKQVVSSNKDGSTTIYQKAPTAHDLEGYWVAVESTDYTVEYSFAECGNVRVSATSKDYTGDSYGQYTLNGNAIDIKYVTVFGNKLSDPLTVDGQQIGISDDGKKLSFSQTDDDTGAVYVLVLDKINEPIELQGKTNPTLTNLNGSWSAKSDGIETTFTFNNGAVTMTLADGISKPTTFVGVAALEKDGDHSHQRLHIDLNSSQMGSDKTTFDKPISVDYYIGMDFNSLVMTNGIDAVTLTR